VSDLDRLSRMSAISSIGPAGTSEGTVHDVVHVPCESAFTVVILVVA